MEQIFIAINDTEIVFGRDDERRRYRTNKNNFQRLMDDVFAAEIVKRLKLEPHKKYYLIMALTDRYMNTSFVAEIMNRIKPHGMMVLNRAQFESVCYGNEARAFFMYIDENTVSLGSVKGAETKPVGDKYLLAQLSWSLLRETGTEVNAENHAKCRTALPEILSREKAASTASELSEKLWSISPDRLKQLAKEELQDCYYDFEDSGENMIIVCGPGAEKYPVLVEAIVEFFAERHAPVIIAPKKKWGVFL